jgi:hypothetical protein
MSISFRNEVGPDIRADTRPDIRLLNGNYAQTRLVGGDGSTAVGAAPATPIPTSMFTGSADPRLNENRQSEPLSVDARLTEIRNGANPRDLSDVKMDQIRELLFGEVQRQSEQRITSLEAKVADLETTLNHRLDAMQARIEALAAETRGEHRSTLDELARGIADLGDRVKRIPRE